MKLLAAEVNKSDISSTSEVMQTVSISPPKQPTDLIFQVLNRTEIGHIPSDVDGQGVVKVTLMPNLSLQIILIENCKF